MDSCDLSGVTMDWADVRFTTLRNCTLPGEPDHVSVQHGFADRLKDARRRLRVSHEPWSQELLRHLSGNDGEMDVMCDQQAGVVALKDVREIGGVAAEAFVRDVFLAT